jgi:hypothetical protein
MTTCHPDRRRQLGLTEDQATCQAQLANNHRDVVRDFVNLLQCG